MEGCTLQALAPQLRATHITHEVVKVARVFSNACIVFYECVTFLGNDKPWGCDEIQKTMMTTTRHRESSLLVIDAPNPCQPSSNAHDLCCKQPHTVHCTCTQEQQQQQPPVQQSRTNDAMIQSITHNSISTASDTAVGPRTWPFMRVTTHTA